MPQPLMAVLIVAAAFGLTWALLVPPWQSPDETSHFAYAESLAQRLALPGNQHRLTTSSAQTLAERAVGAESARFDAAAAPPDWNASDFGRYRAAVARGSSSSDGGGPNNAYTNPPLYYLYADVAYLAASGGNEFDRLYAMRVWTLALLLVSTLFAWLLAGEIFSRRRVPQLACAAITALMPMQTAISSTVNPDALLIALWGAALWLGTRVIKRGTGRRDAVALALVTAAAVVTKATSYALVPPVLLALLLGFLRRPRGERMAAVSWFSWPLLALVMPVAIWVTIALRTGRPPVNTIPQQSAHARAFRVGQFLSYGWQFYLPRLPSMKPDREVAGWPLYIFWVKEGWGVFGWLSIYMPDWVYQLLAIISATIVAPAAAIVARIRGRVRLELLAFYIVALVSLLALVHLTDYRSLIAGDGPVVQGRYLLPLLPLFGLAVGLILGRLPSRWRGQACAAVLAGLVVLQGLALATVAKAFYL